MKVDPITFREKNAMMDLINEKKAKFTLTTIDIIRSFITCTICMPRQLLRKSIFGRKILNFNLGNEFINKDLDIAKIVQKLRTFNYFMKISLDVD